MGALEDILAYYREEFGPLPGQRLVLVEGREMGYSAAADGVVILADLFFHDDDYWFSRGLYAPYAEATLAHELGHLYFGVGIGVDFDQDNWLSEAFAQYLAIAYLEDRYGPDGETVLAPNALVRTLFWLGGAGWIHSYRRELTEAPYRELVRQGIDEAVVTPHRDLQHGEAATNLYYYKGYLVLRALEGWVGQDVVRGALRVAFERHGGGELTPQGWRALVEELSGQDLSAWYTAWVVGGASFDPAVRSFSAQPARGGGWDVEVTLTHEGEGAMPVTVALETARGEVFTQTWRPPPAGERTPARLSMHLPEEPVSVHIDPEEVVPDRLRLNNHQPREVEWGWLFPLDRPDAVSVWARPELLRYAGMELHGRYLREVGASLGVGVDDLGFVLAGLEGSPGLEELELPASPPVARGEAQLWWRRDRGLTLQGQVLGRRDMSTGALAFYEELALTGALWRQPELGLTARTSLPTRGWVLRAAALHGQGQPGVTEGELVRVTDPPDVVPVVGASASLDEIPRLGLQLTLDTLGGQVGGQGPFGMAQLRLLAPTHLVPGGTTTLYAQAGVSSALTPGPDDLGRLASLHYQLGLVPWWRTDEGLTGHHGAQIALRHHQRLMEPTRRRGALTLWSATLEELGVFGGVGVGWLAPEGAGWVSLGDGARLGVEGGVSVRLSSFTGAPLYVNIGAAAGTATARHGWEVGPSVGLALGLPIEPGASGLTPSAR